MSKSTLFLLLFFGGVSLFAQINPGLDFDLNGYINSKLDSGETNIIIPPGRYRVQRVGGTHLSIRNRSNVTIIADNVEMICTETVQAVLIENCNNLKIQGLSVDYDPLPFTQGEIVAISADKTQLTVNLIDGYSSVIIGDKLEIFNPVTGELSSSTYYGTTYNHDNLSRTVVLNKQGRNWSSMIEKVGDIAVLGSQGTRRIPHAIRLDNNTNTTLENVTLYAGTSFGFFETSCSGSKYINCSVDRRPLETDVKVRGFKRMRSNNADAFHSKHAEVGPSYVGCLARYMGDDGIAINGHFHVITETNGNILTVVGKGGNIPNLTVGETVELISYDGERMLDAKILSIEAGRALTSQEINFIQNQSFSGDANNTHMASNVYFITIDRSINLPIGSLINSANKIGNGFEVINCTMGPNRSRGILVKAGNGVITGNTCIDNWGQAIKLASEYSWLEAGSGSNMVVSNNIISGCHDVALAVYSIGGNDSTSPLGAHDNIEITGNQITGSSNPNIVVTSTSNLCFKDNTTSSPNNELLLPWYRNTFGSSEDPTRAVFFENNSEINCTNIEEEEENPETKIKVYPNPVYDKLILQGFNNELPIGIYNSIGQLIVSVLNNDDYINVSKLSQGMYILKQESVVVKFIKK